MLDTVYVAFGLFVNTVERVFESQRPSESPLRSRGDFDISTATISSIDHECILEVAIDDFQYNYGRTFLDFWSSVQPCPFIKLVRIRVCARHVMVMTRRLQGATRLWKGAPIHISYDRLLTRGMLLDLFTWWSRPGCPIRALSLVVDSCASFQSWFPAAPSVRQFHIRFPDGPPDVYALARPPVDYNDSHRALMTLMKRHPFARVCVDQAHIHDPSRCTLRRGLIVSMQRLALPWMLRRRRHR